MEILHGQTSVELGWRRRGGCLQIPTLSPLLTPAGWEAGADQRWENQRKWNSSPTSKEQADSTNMRGKGNVEGRVCVNKKIIMSQVIVWVASVSGIYSSHSVNAFWLVDQHVETKWRSNCKRDKDRPQQSSSSCLTARFQASMACPCRVSQAFLLLAYEWHHWVWSGWATFQAFDYFTSKGAITPVPTENVTPDRGSFCKGPSEKKPYPPKLLPSVIFSLVFCSERIWGIEWLLLETLRVNPLYPLILPPSPFPSAKRLDSKSLTQLGESLEWRLTLERSRQRLWLTKNQSVDQTLQ